MAPGTADAGSADHPPTATALISPGRRIGPYEIVEPLGAGGMGEVYRARDTKLDRDVALKILPPAFAGDPERLARFRREAQLLASLNHPHIGAIYGLEEADGIVCLVLELVEGQTLGQRIASAPLPLRQALEIGVQIAEALEAAHARGVVHRDLKPANVMIAPGEKVKILDFGIAKAVDPVGSGGEAFDLTATGVLVGTVPYMSPEQVRGRAVDARSDVWSFGCVLFEMLTAEKAFARETIADTMNFILEHEPRFSALPAATPPAIRGLLRSALAKDPERRLATVADARAGLEEGRLTLSRRPVRASHVALGVLGLLLLLALGEGTLLKRLIEASASEIHPVFSEGGRLTAVVLALAGLGLLARKGLVRLRGRLDPGSRMRGPAVLAVAAFVALLATSLFTDRDLTAILVLGCGIVAWILYGRRLVRPRRGWIVFGAVFVALCATYQVEGWWNARAEMIENRAIDVYVVLPFERLNDEEEEDLLMISSHYRDTLEAVFQDLDSVRVLPEVFEPGLLRSAPPQCSYQRVRVWLAESNLAPDIVLCSTVDLFEAGGDESGVILVSTVNRVRDDLLERFEGHIREEGSFADIDWLALRTAFRVLHVVSDDAGIELSPSDERLAKRRVLERYLTFLEFREPDAGEAAARAEIALGSDPIEDRLVEQALDAYSSPIDLEAYAARHQAARSALTSKALRE